MADFWLPAGVLAALAGLFAVLAGGAAGWYVMVRRGRSNQDLREARARPRVAEPGSHLLARPVRLPPRRRIGRTGRAQAGPRSDATSAGRHRLLLRRGAPPRRSAARRAARPRRREQAGAELPAGRL